MTHSLRAWLTLPAAVLALLSLPLVSGAQSSQAAAANPFSEYTAAQQAQLKARNARFVKDITALRDNPKLTDAQKQAKYLQLKDSVEKDMLMLLTPAQRTEVLKRKAINEQFQKDLMGLRSDTTMTEDQKKARFQTLMQNRENALLATLPPAQRAVLEKSRQAQMARVKEVQQLGEEIQKSESPAQLKQIQAISAATRQKVQALIADKALTDQAKEARVLTLRHEAQSKIDALLTPAQRTKFARMRAMVSAAPGQ